jgi:formate hydrogenlyase subunit 3/multisubunit Na+/H+ antiporter MnhD subunit
MAALALTGAIALALGGVLAGFEMRRGLAVQAAAMALLGAAGAIALFGGGSAGAVWRDGVSPALGLDPLSGFFLALLAVTAVPTLVYARAYLRSRAAAALTAAFLLALAGLLAARDVTTFLAFWELMTLVPAAAILVVRRDAAVRERR